jgi:hypothetical protein
LAAGWTRISAGKQAVPVMASDVEGAIDYAEAALLRDESPLE